MSGFSRGHMSALTQRTGSHIVLIVVQLFIAVTAALGGIALVVGAVVPELATALSPPVDALEGSPFTSYLLPGLLLAVVLGGGHALAAALVLRRNAWALFVSAGAGFAMLVWIFVQMLFIPFSPLQAVYFAAGTVELGLVLLLLGVVPGRAPLHDQ